MRVNNLSILIGGEAGEGISRSGNLLAKACMRGGLDVFGTNDYQSLIRGGHNFYTLRIEGEEVHSQSEKIELLIALNAETISLHQHELVPDGGLVCDENPTVETLGREVRLFPIPLSKIVKEDLKGPLIMRNTVALGAVVALVNYDLAILNQVLKDSFKAGIAESNVKAAEMGYEYAKKEFRDGFGYRLEKRERAGKNRLFLSGNEAVGLGAIRGGCKFFAGYPMTPTTGLLHFMASNERSGNMVVIHPEGEIAALNMVAGASFAGVRAMTTTSGGGFCLMSEALGMTGMTETPVVIMVGQRPGPSTGLPTYSAQGDLRFVMHASQGEFPRVVIAPGDVEECFYETMWAFNWAEKYQLPVILLTDKYLIESEMSVKPFDVDKVEIERGHMTTGKYEGGEEYRRHKITETGVSPRVIPSTEGAIVRTNADEHDEYGYTTEDPLIVEEMMDKRMRKLLYLARELEERNLDTTKTYGPEQAEVTMISCGSTKGPILEAIKILSGEGFLVDYMQIVYLQPFPVDRVEKVLKTRKCVVIENNKTSQLSGLIREHTLIDVKNRILRYDGRPFNPEQIAHRIKEVMLE